MTHNADWIDRTEYPFDPHYFEVSVGRMHYIDEGNGTPVVMVHGNPTWSFLYRHLVKQLRPNCRCIAMDHLGFGLSDKPENWTYLPEDHAANLTRMIRDQLSVLKDTPALIVWGMKDIAFRKKELQRWKNIFPHARTVQVPHAGHFVQEEAPGELAEAVVPFLDKIPNRPDER